MDQKIEKKEMHKADLLKIRNNITRIGMEILHEKVPLPVTEATELMKPFGKIEEQIDKIIKKLLK